MSSIQRPAVLPYHEDYGIPNETRLRVIKTARATSPRIASTSHRVSLASVYRWLADSRETINTKEETT